MNMHHPEQHHARREIEHTADTQHRGAADALHRAAYDKNGVTADSRTRDPHQHDTHNKHLPHVELHHGGHHKGDGHGHGHGHEGHHKGHGHGHEGHHKGHEQKHHKGHGHGHEQPSADAAPNNGELETRKRVEAEEAKKNPPESPNKTGKEKSQELPWPAEWMKKYAPGSQSPEVGQWV